MSAPRPSWYHWAAMLASSLLAAGGAVLISVHVNTESDRKWCSIVETLDSSYRQSPPTTPSGRNVAANIAELRRSLNCSPD